MQKNFDEFSIQEAMRLANTELGQQLIALMQNQHSATFQNVMDSAKTGNLEQAKRSLSAFLADPQTKVLLQQLQEAQNGRNGK